MITVEEKCACGAALIVRNTATGYSLDAQRKEVASVWEQVDRWRALHVGCFVVPTSREDRHG